MEAAGGSTGGHGRLSSRSGDAGCSSSGPSDPGPRTRPLPARIPPRAGKGRPLASPPPDHAAGGGEVSRSPGYRRHDRPRPDRPAGGGRPARPRLPGRQPDRRRLRGRRRRHARTRACGGSSSRRRTSRSWTSGCRTARGWSSCARVRARRATPARAWTRRCPCSCCPGAGRSSTASAGSTAGPTTTWSSRSRIRSCAAGSRRCCAARASALPGGRAAGRRAGDRPGRAATCASRGEHATLSQKEFALLLALAAHPVRVFTKEELLRDVWGYRSMGRTRTLDSHACRLRHKLAEAGGALRGQRLGRRLPARRRDRAGGGGGMIAVSLGLRRLRCSPPGCCGGGAACRSSRRPATSCAGRCRRRCSGLHGHRGSRRRRAAGGDRPGAAPRRAGASRTSRPRPAGAARPTPRTDVELGDLLAEAARGLASCWPPHRGVGARRRAVARAGRRARRTACGSRRRSRTSSPTRSSTAAGRCACAPARPAGTRSRRGHRRRPGPAGARRRPRRGGPRAPRAPRSRPRARRADRPPPRRPAGHGALAARRPARARAPARLRRAARPAAASRWRLRCTACARCPRRRCRGGRDEPPPAGGAAARPGARARGAGGVRRRAPRVGAARASSRRWST